MDIASPAGGKICLITNREKQGKKPVPFPATIA